MAGILGFGGYVPERIMTNDDWAALVDTTRRVDHLPHRHRATQDRRRRRNDSHHGGGGGATWPSRTPACVANDIDEVIVATDTPEVYTPDTAAFLQHHMGLRYIPAYDLGGSGCAGFVQALDVARSRTAFHGGTILVVGVELISRLISKTDRATSVLFGDAAGAVVVGPGDAQAELLAVVAGTDGSKTGRTHPAGRRHPTLLLGRSGCGRRPPAAHHGWGRGLSSGGDPHEPGGHSTCWTNSARRPRRWQW